MSESFHKINIDSVDVLTAVRNEELLQKQTKNLSREFATLDRQFNKGNITAQQYAKATNSLEREMRELTVQSNKATLANKRWVGSTQHGGKSLNRFNTQLQQGGYQLQDFVVQVQGGTSALTAFSQQGSQFAGIFGAKGAIIGAGIAMGSVAAQMLLAWKNGEEAVESIKGHIKDLKEETKSVRGEIDLLTSSFTKLSQVRVAEEIRDLTREIAEETERYNKVRKTADQVASNESAKRLSNLKAELKELEAILYNSVRVGEQHRITKALIGDQVQELENLKDAQIVRNEKEEEMKEFAESVAQSFLEARDWTDDIGDSIANAALKTSELAVEAERVARAMKAAGGGTALSSDEARRGVLGQRTLPKVIKNKKTKTKKSGGGSKSDPMADLMKELDLRRKIVGMTENQQYIAEQLGDVYGSTSDKVIQGILSEMDALDKMDEKAQDVEDTLDGMADTFTDGIVDIVQGTETISDAFRNMAASILEDIGRILIQQAMIGIIGGPEGKIGSVISTLFGFSKGGAFSGGSVIPFANGGVVSSPTLFPMSGGNTGLMGEAGPEAIMPLKRASDGSLGVATLGSSSSGGVTVVQNFNFAANGDESVKRIIADAAPAIAEMTESSILKSRRAGDGKFKQAFG